MGCVHGAARRRAQQVTPIPAIQAVAAPCEAFLTCFVGMLGCRSRARGSNGLYLEHVLRMGSVLTAAQKARHCSTKSSENTEFLLLRHPRDHPTHLRAHFYGPPTSDWSGAGGRASRAFVGVSVDGKGLTEKHCFPLTFKDSSGESLGGGTASGAVRTAGQRRKGERFRRGCIGARTMNDWLFC